MAQHERRLARQAAVALLVVVATIGFAALALAEDGTRDRDFPESPAPVCEVTPIGAAVCSGATVTFRCSATGGMPGYTYRWEMEPYDGTPLSSEAELTLSGLTQESSGQYRVVATDAAGQSAVSYVTVTVCAVDEVPLAALVDEPVCTISSCILKACVGTLIELCGPGIEGYTYEWHGPDPAAEGATTQCVYIYEPGIYSLTVTDAAGNQATCSRPAPLVPNPDCAITGGVDQLCGGGETEWCAPIAPPGLTYTYLWSGPEDDGATTRCITISTPGTYTVRVTAEYLCWSECSRTLSVGDLDCTITGEEVICAGHTTEFCAPEGAGYTYEWDGPEDDGATTRCITVGTPGIYSVTVRDGSGCEATCYKPLANYMLPDCTITGAGDCCANDSVEWCAPEGYDSYVWHGPEKDGATTRCIWVSTPGDYSVTVADEYGCEATCTRGLSAAPGPQCSITGDSVFCPGETVELCGPEPESPEVYTYVWHGPEADGATTRCITVGTAGRYILTVTDDDSCATACTTMVSLSIVPTCSLVAPDPLPDCGSTGNHLSATVDGPVDGYEWSVSGIGWVITGGEHSSEITYTAGGYGSTGLFTLIITNRDDCPDTCSIEFGCTQREENCTFTQGGWGAPCPDSQQGDPMSTQPGCIRDHYFSEVYPTGVVLGGAPYWAKWTTPGAVENYLPARGAVGVLRANLTNPTTTPMGKLGSQLLALRLNRDYSCAGVFYDLGMASTETCYGDFVIPNTIECGSWFAGMTVNQFLALANIVVGGTPSALTPYGATLTNMHQTATCLNEMFDECDPYSITVSAGPDVGGIAEDGATLMGAPSPAAETSMAVPAAFDVSQINPNPINRGTTITYGLPGEGRIVIEIYDVQGAKVATLIDQTQSAGYHSVYWDGTNSQGRSTGSGVYFCRGRFGDESDVSRKMIKLQ